MNTNRRQFMQIAAGAGVGTLAERVASAKAQTSINRSFEHGAPLREFQYGQISFQPGLHQAQFEKTHDVLMALSEDSLLRPYRRHVGLAAPGCDLGGWYSAEDFAAETFGQWLSALSRYYASTQDEDTRTKVDRLVRGLAATVEPRAKLYGQAYLMDKGAAYHYDKLVCGLMDAHQFARQPVALDVLSRITDATISHLPGRAVDFFEGWGAAESYTLPENQFIAWQRGGEAKHLELAKEYLHDSFFDRLARGENALPGRHAYSHVNALCSAAKAYLVLGNERYLRAASNGFAFIEAQSFATGGWGPNEVFLPYPGYPQFEEFGLWSLQSLGESLTRAHYHFETCCGAYAHFKLTRYLLRITKNSEYGDSMERVMFNTVLGAKELLPDGRAFYASDYNFDGRKTYYNGGGGVVPMEWPCCSGTLTQVAADYRISTYFCDAEGVYVNLFIPSTLKWTQHGELVSLTQSGSYPLGDVISMVIEAARPVEFTLRLRIPAWARQPSISVNGKRLEGSLSTGRFAIVRRQWRSGDRIDLELPRQLELKAVDMEHPNEVAVVYGPLVLFAVCKQTPRVTRRQLLAASRANQEASEWCVATDSGPLRLTPFWLIQYERYTTYMSVA
jgi:DUF1680 family protein